MKYWDDMIDKCGFSDGEATPPDAEARREIYVKTVNLLAEEIGLSGRIQSYDRGGFHNNVMIVETPDGDWPDEAIELASQLGLDDYVVVECRVLENEWEDFISNNLDRIVETR